MPSTDLGGVNDGRDLGRHEGQFKARWGGISTIHIDRRRSMLIKISAFLYISIDIDSGVRHSGGVSQPRFTEKRSTWTV